MTWLILMTLTLDWPERALADMEETVIKTRLCKHRLEYRDVFEEYQI